VVAGPIYLIIYIFNYPTNLSNFAVLYATYASLTIFENLFSVTVITVSITMVTVSLSLRSDNTCKISQLMRLSSKLVGLSERNKKRTNGPHLSVIVVSGNTFQLLSQLLGPAQISSCTIITVTETSLKSMAKILNNFSMIFPFPKRTR